MQDPNTPTQEPPAGGARVPGTAGAEPAPGNGADGARRRAYRWGDPAVSAAAARELDGMSFFREMMAGRLPAPPIAATLDFGWVSVEPGKMVFEITSAPARRWLRRSSPTPPGSSTRTPRPAA